MGNTHEADGAALRAKFFPAKPCDCCESAAAVLYCSADSAFMCVACDARAHDNYNNNNNNNNKHERFWMCDVCEQAPASVTCKADAASLCVACDRDIHWANPLAGRHDRVPAVPFFGATEFIDFVVPCDSLIKNQADNNSNNNNSSSSKSDLKSMELLFQDTERFLNFDRYQIPSHPNGDSIVPVRATVKPPLVPSHEHSSENRLIIDFAGSSCYSAPSLSQSVSSSSIDLEVVPDGSESSHPFARNTNLGVDYQIPQVVGMEREARVLRYREKRKNRKFEKTIRYASRKAYAETRPRIKGRFAKKTDAETDFGEDAGYGVISLF